MKDASFFDKINKAYHGIEWQERVIGRKRKYVSNKLSLKKTIWILTLTASFLLIVYLLHQQGKETKFNDEFSRFLSGPEIVTKVEIVDNTGEEPRETVLEGEETIGRFFNSFWYMDMVVSPYEDFENSYQMTVTTDNEGETKQYEISVDSNEMSIDENYYLIPSENELIEAVQSVF